MNMATKKGIFEEHLKAWLKAKGKRQQRREITRHVCFVAGVHPKSVSRSFRRVQLRDTGHAEQRGRAEEYTPDVTLALKEVWDMAGEPCGENLHSQIGEYVRILKRDGFWKPGEETTKKLLRMSLGTVKNRLAKFPRQRFPSHGKSTTSPSAIHALIPVRTGPWNEAPVGTVQIDTVAHCGGTTVGDYVFTVNSADVATLWGDRRAQWNKGQEATVRSMTAMDEATPFPILERHPDSGSEFINWHCQAWSQARGQKLTRSRPNHKNDNCFVEERNGHIVRRWVGHTRFDAREVVAALNAVYDVLTPFLNHFVASRRIVSKERIGARWKVTREKKSLTPYQRVLARTDVTEEVKTKLKQAHESLNPLLLHAEIDRRLKIVFTLQERHGEPRIRREVR